MAGDKVNFKFKLEGEPAEMYRELRARGLVKSASDAMAQGVQRLYDETLERDMKRVRVQAGKRLHRELDGEE